MPTSPFLPVFELTVYAPKSVDPTEATVLSPAAGAPHSDPFVLTTVQGIGGTKPYLDVPSARAATIDPLNKTATVGTITVKLLDQRTTVGGSNASRWVSAFVGDGAGGNMLLGRLVKIRQSLDNGSTYSTYAVGRITDTSLNGKLWVQITVRDRSDDLGVDIFIGAPASLPSPPTRTVAIAGRSSATVYANLAQVAPIGLLQPYGDFPTTAPLTGKTRTAVGGVFFIDVDRTGDTKRSIVTQALLDTSLRTQATGKSINGILSSIQPPKIYISTTGVAGSFSEYDLAFTWLYVPGRTRRDEFRTTSLENVAAVVRLVAAPSAGTTVYFYIVDPNAPPSTRTPLLIDDVSFTDYLADLCAGKFGRIGSDGKPVRSVPFNANGVIGSNRAPYRRCITEASKLNTEIEAVCKAYNVAYFLAGDGTVTLVDLRRTSSTVLTATLTDDDLVEQTGNVAWRQSRDEAVTALLGTYYSERQITDGELPAPFQTVSSSEQPPDIPTVRIQDIAPLQVLVPYIGARSGDIKSQTFKIDAKGFRFIPDASRGEKIGEQLRADVLQGEFEDYAHEISGPFGLGPSYVDVVCRRGSANANVVTPGTWVQLSLSALPNPATNQRGGNRLGLCISRTDDGPTIKLKFLDGGANSVAIAPTLAAPSISGTAQASSLSMAVTLNASLEPARVSYAITAQSVGTRPVDTDPSWVSGPPLVGSGSVSIANLPSRSRVWLRGRSEPTAGAGLKLPSAYAYPSSGTGYVDTPSMTAPSSVSVLGLYVNDTVVSWVNGESWPETEVLLVQGTAPGSWSDSNRIRTMAVGSIQYPIFGLAAATQYTVGIRGRDSFGGTSTVATLTFITGPARDLDVPSNPVGFSGSQSPQLGMPQSDGLYGLAVAATVFPGSSEFVEEVETAQFSGTFTAPVSVGTVPNVLSDWTRWQGIAPNDGLRRVLSARQVRGVSDASDYTVGVTVMPWTARVLPQFGDVVGFNKILRVQYGESTDGKSRLISLTVGPLVDAVHLHYRVVAINSTVDASDFSDTNIIDGDQLLIEAPDATRKVTFTIPHPARNTKVVARAIAYAGFVEGESIVIPVDAAPPAVNAAIHASRVGVTGALSVDVAFAASDGPVLFELLRDQGGGSSVMLTKTLTASTTLDGTSDSVLGNIVVPVGVDSVLFRARITDVAGIVYLFGPAAMVPALFDCQPSTSEPSSVLGRLTLVVTDPNAVLDPTTPIYFKVTRLGVTNVESWTTRPGGTAGTYTKDISLLPHSVTVDAFAKLVDATERPLGSFTFDANKISDIAAGPSAANNGVTSTVSVTFDSDTAVGANCARYSLNGGSSWTNLTVPSSLAVSFNVTRTGSKQTAIVQGLNAIDGNWGNQGTCEVDAYIADGPSLSAVYVPLTSSTGQIVWSFAGTIVTVSIDGGTPGTPAGSPIAITLDGAVHSYLFTATQATQTTSVAVSIPALALGSGPLPAIDSFYSPSNSPYSFAQHTTTDIIDLVWSTRNARSGATFDLDWALDGGAHTLISGVALSGGLYQHLKTGTGGHGLDLVGGGTVSRMRYTLIMKDGSGNEVAYATLDIEVDHT